MISRLAIWVLDCMDTLAVDGSAAGNAIVDPAFNPIVGRRPTEKVDFPAIKDWNTLSIRLERTACYGTCPAYSVEIAGDGSVNYMGEHFVAAKGPRSAKISEKAVRALYEAFRNAEFFWTFDEYQSPVTDMPTQTISISFDGHSKTVVDYAGQHVGLPKVVADLEDAVDAAAGTAQWIGHEERP